MELFNLEAVSNEAPEKAKRKARKKKTKKEEPIEEPKQVEQICAVFNVFHKLGAYACITDDVEGFEKAFGKEEYILTDRGHVAKMFLEENTLTLSEAIRKKEEM